MVGAEASGRAEAPAIRILSVVGAMGLLAGCGLAGPRPDIEPRRMTDTDSSTTSSEATTTTSRPATTTTAPPETSTTTTTTTTTSAPAPPEPPPAEVLRRGDSGQHVSELQQQLSDLGYWLGTVDGSYGFTTQQAVLAFQKAEGLARDGIAGPETRRRLESAGRPTARSDSGDLIEVDLTRQLVLVVSGGEVVHALNTSTGKPGTPTPAGRFTINRQIDGWREAPLGTLYRPKYFNGGIALHGYPSVPAYPASHGCTRLSNAATDMLWASGRAEIGTPVWVY